ncbi:hypothetical protein QYE76_000515 [Lolium multiflorum]|uniref:Uncharacterized protein n=1 Tax=Lolium multiflorum TaxID=4521 RepID=A0AAD8RK30_LOLMU|nr:hypothetical protein QYE76_000515 [Lolium multiflorum]
MILVREVNQLEVVVMNQDSAAMHTHTLEVVVTNTMGRAAKHTAEVVVMNLVGAVRQQEETVIVERQMLKMKMALWRGGWKKKIQMVIVVIPMIPMIPMIRMTNRMKRMCRFLIHGIRTSRPE